MNETKFTPGPWHVRDSMRELDGDPTAFPIDASQTCCIADVWADDEQAEANARLIAAAPDLYAALSAYVDDDGRLSERERKNLARAALAKVSA